MRSDPRIGEEREHRVSFPPITHNFYPKLIFIYPNVLGVTIELEGVIHHFNWTVSIS